MPKIPARAARFLKGSRRYRIDLHIGLEKTGTTSIQSFLSQHRNVLAAKYGCLFPRSLGGRLSANLAAACQTRERPDDLRKLRGLLTASAVEAYRNDLVASLARELAAKKPQRVVISCEHFSSRLIKTEEIRLLHDFLQPFASEISLWVYLRRQDQFEISAYSTAVRAGATGSFRWPAPGQERPFLNYDTLLERWASVFGANRMRVRLFERERLTSGNAVADFCASLGLPHLPAAEEEKNTSLNVRQLEFLRAFNERVPRFHGDHLNPLRGDIHLALAAVQVQGEKFGDIPGAAQYYERFLEGNREVARRWFTASDDIPDSLFTAPEPDVAEHRDDPLTTAELIDICAQLWSHAQRALEKERGISDELRKTLAQLSGGDAG